MSKKLNVASLNERTQQTKEELSKKENSLDKTILIPINDIDFNEDNFFNLNDSDGSIEELAANIKENGLLHNIVVSRRKNGRYLLISGERRTKACILNGNVTIRANVVSDTSELGILKKMFYANTETREYSINEKIEIINAYKEKLAEIDESCTLDAAAFRKDIAEAFRVNERQAIKLITINDELSKELKELLYSGEISINDAASLAQLPEKPQAFAAEMLSSADAEHKDEVKKKVFGFAKNIKEAVAESQKELWKIKAKETYVRNCIQNLENELNELKETEQNIEIQEKVEKIQEQLSKYTKKLIETDKEYMNVRKKEDAEIKRIYKDISSKKKKNTAEKQKNEKDVIKKEIISMESSLKKLRSILPSEELEPIAAQLEAFKDKMMNSKKNELL